MRGFYDSSPEQKATVLLTRAFNELLTYLNNDNGFVRVDIALKSDSGTYLCNVKDDYLKRIQNKKASQRIDISEAVEESVYTFHPQYSDLFRLFKRQIKESSQNYRKSLLCDPRLIGSFDENTKMYAALIGNGGMNRDFIKYLFTVFLLTIKDKITKEIAKKENFDSGLGIRSYEISRKAVVQFLSAKLYQDSADVRGEELYETLCLVSSAAYERAPNHGKIGLLTDGIEKRTAFVRLAQPVDINRDQVRHIRKLLEMSDIRNNMLMIEGGKISGIFTPKENFNNTEIIFRGNGKWDFIIKNRPVLSFDSVKFSFNSRTADCGIEKRLLSAFGISCDTVKLKTIINEAKRQPHGTTIIVTNYALNESNRLSEAGRAIKIEPIEVEADTVRSITAIDGAILLDPYGKCFAIGVILDGIADSHGSTARGARYNSAITYVDYWSRQENNRTIAVIVSEDDSIDFYPPINVKVP